MKYEFHFSFSCLGKIRTLTNGTRIRCATITPQGNVLSFSEPLSLLTLQNYNFFLIPQNFCRIIFNPSLIFGQAELLIY